MCLSFSFFLLSLHSKSQRGRKILKHVLKKRREEEEEVKRKRKYVKEALFMCAIEMKTKTIECSGSTSAYFYTKMYLFVCRFHSFLAPQKQIETNWVDREMDWVHCLWFFFSVLKHDKNPFNVLMKEEKRIKRDDRERKKLYYSVGVHRLPPQCMPTTMFRFYFMPRVQRRIKINHNREKESEKTIMWQYHCLSSGFE